MKKSALLFFLLSMVGFSCYSQSFIHAYTNENSNVSFGDHQYIATDKMNNVINTSTYSGTVQVGSGSFTSSGYLGTLIIKRDDNDSLLWAKSLGCEAIVLAGGIYIDSYGNLYVTGCFGDSLIPTTLDCSPHQIVNPIGFKAFIIKYSPNGTVLWSNSINIQDGTTNFNIGMIDVSGNGTDKIVISSFIYNVAPQTIGSSVLDPSNSNLFYAVIDEYGNWVHAKSFGGPILCYGGSVGMNSNDEVFFSASIKGTLNFGAAGTLDSPSNYLDFICKADSSGNFAWAHLNGSQGGGSYWRSKILVHEDDVYMLGSFQGPMTLGTTTLYSAPAPFSSYMTKIDNAGNYLWAKKYGGYETHFCSASKTNNTIYISGNTDSNYPNNSFDTYNLIYANSLPSETNYGGIDFLIATDLNGNVLRGAAMGFDNVAFNVRSMSCTNTKTYLTGNAGYFAALGNYLISPQQVNSANYVAVYSDSSNIISGKAYYDFNNNDIFDGSDVYYSDYITFTNGNTTQNQLINGQYNLGANQGLYITSVTNPPLYYTYSPTFYQSSFTNLSSQEDSLNDFAFQPVSGQNDLVIDFTVGQSRPGFNGVGYVTLKNKGTTPKSGVMTAVIKHPNLTITSCSPAAVNLASDSVTLNYQLNPIEEITYLIEYYLDPSAPLSTEVLGIAEALDITDLTPSNNVDTLIRLVTGAYDPNSKEVFPTGFISPQFVSNENELEYVINFQNTGNDTAFTVILRDTLSNFLSKSTFKLVSSSHPVTVNFYDNEIWFRFYNILLPDSNTNEPLSHGFVKYLVVPNSNCVIGTEINNIAYIYFDYNSPIVTNITSTLVEEDILNVEDYPNETTSKGIITSVYPVPSNGNLVNVKSNSLILSLEIYNSNGQLLQAISDQNSYITCIPLDKIQDGIYYLRVIYEKSESMHKLVKIK